MAYRETKWALALVDAQRDDGSWGFFHTLSNPVSHKDVTTEQALRRLQKLGFTIEDEPIQRAVGYMRRCLAGETVLPDYREKLHDWDLFTALMLSTWIRRFTLEDENANRVAGEWAQVVSCAFQGGCYSHEAYVDAYVKAFRKPPRGGRFIDISQFYIVSLLSGGLAPWAEPLIFDYFLRAEQGIYYVYPSALRILPAEFQSLDACRYLGGIELLAEYRSAACREKLRFVGDWLGENRGEDGSFDMGPKAKDGVHFPLSDSWRSPAERKADCGDRIYRLLEKIRLHG